MEARIMLETVLKHTTAIEPLTEDLIPVDSLLSNGFINQPLRFIPR